MISQDKSIPINRAGLFPPQAELLDRGFLHSKENWIITAPTGAGKTLMGEWAMLQAVRNGRRAAYLAPLKAIVEEKHADWQAKYPEVSIGLFTGETTRAASHRNPKDEQLLLLTPEKMAAYLQAWKRHLGWISEIDVVVLDEFHLVGDLHRGPTLECLIGRLQRVNPFARVVALSATLSNRAEIASWLRAKEFVTEWRPVPVTRRIEKFKKVAHKIDMLVAEVEATVRDGGKVLVFVNSRRRSEQIAIQLSDLGIKLDFNHAGLDRSIRSKTQKQMRSGDLDVVVSTSTLEMGVNFPARKVVIYDSYGFDGEGFSPMPVRRYLQCAGRAGRAGYDTTGEAVLFLPTWANGKIDYLGGQPEPALSGLFSKGPLMREVLNEVATRLSISDEHLDTNFAHRTLWRTQGGRESLAAEVELLALEGLLKRDDETERYLSETALGRTAAQMSVSPETVILLRRLYDAYPVVTEFDLLVGACLSGEVTPKLGFNFEEIDLMTDLLLSVESHILDGTAKQLTELDRRVKEKQMLSAIKCASILLQHTQGDSLAELAKRYDCYEMDLQILKQNTNWVLETAQRVFSILWKQQVTAETGDEDAVEKRGLCCHEKVCRALRVMIEYGIPRHCIGLVEIPGIGAKRAQALVRAGYCSPTDLVKVGENAIAKVLKLRPETAAKLLAGAEEIVEGKNDVDPFEIDAVNPVAEPPYHEAALESWDSKIDPYRLRRALELNVDHVSVECVRVSGGAEPHRVSVNSDALGRHSYSCDCIDFAKGQVNCKHIIRARLELHDDQEILILLQRLEASGERTLRYALGNMWMSICGLYDAFNDRNVDYSGKKFLLKAKLGKR